MANTDFNYWNTPDLTDAAGLEQQPFKKAFQFVTNPGDKTEAPSAVQSLGLTHGSITGLGGFQSPGMWNYKEGNFPGEASGIPSSVAQKWNVPAAPASNNSDPAFDQPGQVIGGEAKAPPSATPEVDSSEAPGQPTSLNPQDNAAQRPTLPSQNEGFRLFPRGSMLDRLMDNIGNWRDQHRMELLALAGGLAGSGGKNTLQAFGQGLGRGFTNAAQMVPAQNALNNQNATMQALVGQGLPPDIARAASGNPAILQQLLPRLFGNKQQKFTQIGHDQYGQPTYGFVDEVAGKVYDLSGKEVSGGQSLQGTTGTEGLHGEEFLQTLDPSRANMIRMVGEGRGAFPSGPLLKTPYGQMLSQQITQAYPDINQYTFPGRQKAYSDWYGGGKHADAMGAITQAATHADHLTGTLDALGNVPGGRAVNAPLNWLGDVTGMGKSGQNFGPAGLNIHALADELSKIWKGGTNSDAEVRAWEEKFPINGTPEQQKAAMRKAVELYEGGIDKLEKLRHDELGSAADTLPPVVDPQTGARIQHLKDWANGRASTPQAFQGGAPAGASQMPTRIQGDADFNKLPSGALYVGPDNVPRRKP